MSQDTKTIIHNETLGDLFENDTFKAFVLEFHFAQENSEMMEFGDIMRNIFENESLYKKFIKYCTDQGYGFLTSESRNNLKISISLLAFEQARQRVKQATLDSLHEILGITQKGLEIETSLAHIPGTSISFWQGLMLSIQKGIPTNNYGQVIYMIGKTEELYEVYSHQAGRHFVDKNGGVTTLELQNKAKRIVLLQRIKKYQIVLSQISLEEHHPDREELKALFLQEKQCEWNQSLEMLVRFRSWLGEKLREMQDQFQNIQEKDVRKPRLAIVGGSFVGD